LHAQPAAQLDLAEFERKAVLCKELGAPTWSSRGTATGDLEFDKDDPYTEWYMHHASLLKIFPPKDVFPCGQDYADKVRDFGKRCEILRKLGSSGVERERACGMPEAFFSRRIRNCAPAH